MGQHLAQGFEPEILVAMPAVIPKKQILTIFQRCEEEFPMSKIYLSLQNLMGSYHSLMKDEVNLAIVFWTTDHMDLESIPLFSIELIPVAAPGFLKKSGLQQPLTMTMMREHVHVTLGQRPQNANEESYGIQAGGREWRVDDEYTRKEIIMSGFGWGRLPKHMIQEELEQGHLIPLRIKNYPGHQEVRVRLARKTGKAFGPIHQKLWNDFIEFFSPHSEES